MEAKTIKKIVLCFLFIALSCGAVFSQDTNFSKDANLSKDAKDWNWGGIIRVDPLTTILNYFAGSVFGFFSFGVIADWVPYLTPSIGIPVEIDVSTLNSLYGILGGIEIIPLRHKEKSGLCLSALGGLYYFHSRFTFGLKTHIGYQLVTKHGFVFNPAFGVRYIRDYGDKPHSFTPEIRVNLGFAYKKRK